MSTRIAVIAASAILTLAALASLVLAALTGRSAWLLLVVIQTGALLALLVLGAAWAKRARSAANARATRIANLERRLATYEERADAAQQRAESVERASVQRRSAVDELRGRIAALEVTGTRRGDPDGDGRTIASLVALGTRQGAPLVDFLDERQAIEAVSAAVASDRPLDAVGYLDAFPDLVEELTLTESRQLLKGLRRLGYLQHAADLVTSMAARFSNPADERAADLYRSELALYRGEVDLDLDLPPFEGEPSERVVLHVVGKALPDTQSGYTLRTQYTVEAQRRLGIEPVVVAQSGASERPHAETETYEHRGIRYYLLGGPQRGSVPWDAWLRANVLAFAEVVRLARPAAIHTHSDFMNALIALPVAEAYGIPVVNETRGFWEESWLSRTATAEGWDDLHALAASPGLPEMYGLRVEREAEARSRSDAVVTLAQVMRTHIDELADRFGLPMPSTSIVPNAVQADDFPVTPADPALRAELGIEDDAIVVGYISSIVEYEGIDTLVRAAYEIDAALRVARDVDLDESLADDAGGVEGGEDATDDVGSGPSLEAAGRPLEALHASILGTAAALAPRDIDEKAPEGAEGSTAPTSAELALVDRLRRVHPDEKDATLLERAGELLDAVAPYRRARMRLLIVGTGTELPHLEALALELGLEDAIFTGRVPHERVLDHYALIDLFVVPRKRAAVTELVTPLKPFEALASGRPCLFSDVQALAEIAADSGCVELFRADDHHDLAVTAARLLADPDRLAQMSRHGAEWVRDERTWDMNAITYLGIYRDLGLTVDVPPVWADLAGLRERGIGATTIVRRLATGPVPPTTGWFLLEPKRYTASGIMQDGWKIARHPAIRFGAGMDWEAAGRANRSWGFHLHAWEFIDPVLQEYVETGDESLLRWMLDIALDWWSSVAEVADEDTMAWYDMSLSLRMPRLARLLVATARSSLEAEAVRLIEPALEHIRRAGLDQAFNANNNHGFFAAAAALDLARWLAPLPGTDALHALGVDRMRTMLESQFGADGGHLEHSPDYHRMLLRSFEQALDEGLVDDDETAARITRASRVLGWLVQPDGALVQFGDSPRFDVSANELTSIDERSTFMLTDGAEGVPEEEELLVLPDTGYAIVRSPQPASSGQRLTSSYLALQAGFHSRAHKHADDLTFTWFDRGQEILVDAGRFGYIDLLPQDSPDRRKGFYYSAPERQYVESTIAHNTVEVDGTDIERRARTPYGSALGHCELVDGRFVLRGSVDHGHYRHDRTLILVPGARLEVRDRITPTGDPVDAVAWFNMPGDSSVEVAGDAVEVAFASSDVRMRVSGSGRIVPPVRGQREPMRGWRSLVDREVVPSWSLGFRTPVSEATELVTVFELDGSARGR